MIHVRVAIALAIAGGLLLRTPALHAQSVEENAEQANLVVTGTVMVPGTREAVFGATVVIREGSLATQGFGAFRTPLSERRTQTDADGRFAFSGLTDGLHELAVEYPEDRVDRPVGNSGGFTAVVRRRPGKTIELTRGVPPPDVELWMMRSGTMSGRVVDVDGNPVAGACVDLLKPLWYRGGEILVQPSLSIGSPCETDADGQFRISAPEGTYVVRARARTSNNYSTAAIYYYPGRSDPIGAIPVAVNANTNVPGIDIRIEETRLYRARFEVSLPEYLPGVPEPTLGYLEDVGGVPEAWIRPVDGIAPSLVPTEAIALEPLSEDAYATPGLPPGEYEMLVSYPNHVQNVLSNEFEIDWTAHDPIGMTRFTLADEDIDLGLVPEPPRFDVGGRAIFRSGAFAGAELDLAALPELIFMNEPYAVTSTPSRASVGPDGSFVVENLYPALFAMLFQVELLPANWYVAASSSQGRNILTEGLRVEGAPAPIEVVLAGDAGRIEGRVLNSDGDAVPDARVILIPPAERRGPMLDFPTAVADHAGVFSLERIPPGEYRILAVNPSGYPERNPYWQSPTFLADYEGRGERISIEPSAGIVMNPEAVPFAF